MRTSLWVQRSLDNDLPVRGFAGRAAAERVTQPNVRVIPGEPSLIRAASAAEVARYIRSLDRRGE